MTRLLVITAAIAATGACSGDKNASTKAPPAAKVSDAAPPAVKAATSPIPAATRQLVVGVTDAWDEHPIELRLFERQAGGAWKQVGEPWPGHVGKTGLGWGRGLHGLGAPSGADGPVKREGDGKAAAGVFRIGAAYGYDKAPVAGTQLPYHQVTDTWRCVDDAASARYNTIFDSQGMDTSWKSAEDMRRKDALYRWVIDIDHNTPKPKPGAGSCIFFHVWRGAGQPTVGCTAMPRPRIEAMLGKLDAKAQPVYVVLPREVYTELAAPWRLPKLL